MGTDATNIKGGVRSFAPTTDLSELLHASRDYQSKVARGIRLGRIEFVVELGDFEVSYDTTQGLPFFLTFPSS